MEFRPTVSGVFYVGVSGIDGRNATFPDDNMRYDATLEGSGIVSGTTGFYQIELTYGESTGADFIIYDERGDENLFRDQGQILIQGNTITDSLGYAITVTAGTRDGQGGDLPHPGPVRNTPKLNTENVLPGVVIANNVLAFNGDSTTGQGGGIYFAGDQNFGGQQTAAVPFGRIVNNTIYGGVQPNAVAAPVDIVFMMATSSGMANDIIEFRKQLPVLDAQMRAANVDARYGLVTFPGQQSEQRPATDPGPGHVHDLCGGRQPLQYLLRGGRDRVRQPSRAGGIERLQCGDDILVPPGRGHSDDYGDR